MFIYFFHNLIEIVKTEQLFIIPDEQSVQVRTRLKMSENQNCLLQTFAFCLQLLFCFSLTVLSLNFNEDLMMH